MLSQSAAMVVKKLNVDDKITACVKQILVYLLGVICKVSDRETLSDETFCFPEKRLQTIFKFCTSSNVLFFFIFLFLFTSC